MTSVATSKHMMKGGEFLITDANPNSIFTRDDLEEIQYQIASAIKEFFEKEVIPRVEEIEALNSDTIHELMRKAGDVGMLGLEVPTAMGGYGQKKSTALLVGESHTRQFSFAGCVGVHTSVGMIPIVYFGTEAQRKQYLTKLLSGEWIAAYCLTEPHCGSDAMAIRTTATLSEDGKHYLINGSKMWITNAGFANLFNVAAKVDGKKFTMFIVEADSPGITLGAEEKKMGLTGSSTRPVFFDNVKVPVENVLGEIGKGHHIAFNALNMGRMNIGSASYAQLKRSISISVKYAKMRKAFGKTIADFGLIKHKLAEMAIRAYAVESMAFRTAGLIDDQLQSLDTDSPDYLTHSMEVLKEYAIESSIMKVYGSEAQAYGVDEALQIFGGNGYSKEYPAERDYRDARPTRIFEGTNEINRLLIVDMLIKRAMSGTLPIVSAGEQIIKDVYDTGPLPQLDPDQKDSSLFSKEKTLISNMKKASIMLLWQAAQKWMIALADEQEVVAAISDCVMETYAAESTYLRTLKHIANKGEEASSYQISMMQVFLNDAVMRMEITARKTLAVIAEGAELTGSLKSLQRLLRWQPINTVFERRKIADRIIDRESYPFD
ncbi:MAG: acyl-CoA dehydrogenase domain-containing protein [bacterium]|nr:MAG: acyl-CoA dehydrogenase domain-containing protein [bacterium]